MGRIEKNLLNRSSENLNWLIYNYYSKYPHSGFLKFWFLHFLQLITSRITALKQSIFGKRPLFYQFLNFWLNPTWITRPFNSKYRDFFLPCFRQLVRSESCPQFHHHFWNRSLTTPWVNIRFQIALLKKLLRKIEK